MKKKILILGNTGKMGLALVNIFKGDYEVLGKNSKNFDATDLDHTKNVIDSIRPEILINTIAFMGIDACELEPHKAFVINTEFPKLLAELSVDMNFLLIHLTTDAVFSGKKGDTYTEKDPVDPINFYGFTKFGGESFIKALANQYFIFRIPLLFGPALKNTQFVEKMLKKIKEGQTEIRVSDDLIVSPSYSCDIAKEIRRIMEKPLPYGFYNICNNGKASLYEFFKFIVDNLGLKVNLLKASYKDFPHNGLKNTIIPMGSDYIKPLRNWEEAALDYCSKLNL